MLHMYLQKNLFQLMTSDLNNILQILESFIICATMANFRFYVV